HKGGKAESATASHYLGAAIDVHDLFDQAVIFFGLLRAAALSATATWATTTATLTSTATTGTTTATAGTATATATTATTTLRGRIGKRTIDHADHCATAAFLLIGSRANDVARLRIQSWSLGAGFFRTRVLILFTHR